MHKQCDANDPQQAPPGLQAWGACRRRAQGPSHGSLGLPPAPTWPTRFSSASCSALAASSTSLSACSSATYRDVSAPPPLPLPPVWNSGEVR